MARKTARPPPGPNVANDGASTVVAPLRFAGFELLAEARELRRFGMPVQIGQRALELLLVLVKNANRLVTKEELITAIWGGRLVEISNLTVQIATLRRVLGQHGSSADIEQFIRTVSGQGYIFIAPIADSGCPVAAIGRSPLPAGPAEPLTMFIGRESECATLGAALRANRIVSLAGIGGVGKTRLALRLRGELAPAYPDGVFFVDLAPLTAARQVSEAVAAVLGAGAGSDIAEDAIVAALRTQRSLLILDNAEHVTSAVRQLVALILEACPGVTALVTSRESLGLPGEAVIRLQPFALPPPGELLAEQALRYDAVRLLVDRARALMPDFAVDDANAAHVTDVCRRLDGVALAIEMAVPRLEVLSPRQLSERLSDRFQALTSLRHDVLPRQRTLRAIFDWSWELLGPAERHLLQFVAVFPGGATIEALEELAPASGETGSTVVDLLTTLAQKSLLVITAAGLQGEPRYTLLEITRQYALDQLAPAQRTDLCRRQACHVASRFEQAQADWPTSHSAAWLARYAPEADNLRAAMRWAFDAADETELALRLVAASVSLWWELPGLPLREGRQWCQSAIERIGPQTPATIQGWLWFGQSWTDTVDGDTENFPAAERAVRLFRAAGDAIGLGAALWRATSTVMYRDEHRPAASTLLAEALEVLQAQPATKWQALCLIRRADLLQHEHALGDALAAYDQALALVQATGYGYGQMVCGGNRSFLLFKLGRRDEAVGALQALRAVLPVGLTRPLVSQLAMLLAAAGQDREALAAIADSLTGTLSIGMVATLGRTLEALALLLAESEDSAAAAPLLGFVLKLHPAGRTRLGPRQIAFERLTALLDAALPPEPRGRLLAQGAAWTPAEVTSAALKLCQALANSVT